MHADKARELFSAYWEGKLDAAMKASLERRLAADERLRAEYDAFAATCRALSLVHSKVPEPGFDLHDRVMARIDRYAWEKARGREPWYRNWRTATATGIAALLLVSAGITLTNRSGSPIASMGPSELPDRLYVRSGGGETVVTYQTAGEKTVVIRELGQGRELARVRLDGRGFPMGQMLRSPVVVRTPQPALLQVAVEGQAEPLFVAIPGLRQSLPIEGRGTVRDLAVALADRYRVPVVVATDSKRSDIVWKLDGTDSVGAATQALRDSALAVEMRPDGALWIQ
ncbi:MAG: hypothetical protein N2109_00255 [Fimbriimonadales bacterium]|nr:hypothetical protein [Fimbriimonadales bacterium]